MESVIIDVGECHRFSDARWNRGRCFPKDLKVWTGVKTLLQVTKKKKGWKSLW